MKYFSILLIVSVLGWCGCVERYISVTSRPAGAIVWLNDEEVGTTPVTVPFTWYGEYSVVLRKEGCQTLKTSQKLEAPVYQWVGLDLIAECLLPIDFVDKHEWAYELQPQSQPEPEVLIERAQEMREQTLKQFQ